MFEETANLTDFLALHIVEGVSAFYTPGMAPQALPTLRVSDTGNFTILLQIGFNSQGQPVVSTGDIGVTVNDTTLVQVDTRVNASAGVYIHLVDTVLSLNNNYNVATMLSLVGASDFVLALTKEGLLSTLETLPGVTVFAPTNDAMASLRPQWQTLSSSVLAQTLQSNWLSSSALYAAQLPGRSVMTDTYLELRGGTGTGGEVVMAVVNSSLAFLSATVVQANILASNGVIHLTNEVLRPWLSYQFSKEFTIPSTVNGTKVDSASISATKDCIAASGSSILSGWTLVYHGNEVHGAHCVHAIAHG